MISPQNMWFLHPLCVHVRLHPPPPLCVDVLYRWALGDFSSFRRCFEYSLVLWQYYLGIRPAKKLRELSQVSLLKQGEQEDKQVNSWPTMYVRACVCVLYSILCIYHGSSEVSAQ